MLASDVPLDLILVPGVAFDRSGNRCGRGRGFYDRFLAKLQQKTESGTIPRMPTLAGLCLQEQLVEQVPTDENDFVLDYVVCPEGVLPARPPTQA